MINRWSDPGRRTGGRHLRPDVGEAVALRTYTARLLGREPALVLHGGGNASVRRRADRHRRRGGRRLREASGFDMSTIEPAGLRALDLDALLRLRILETLTDEAM